MPPESNNLQPGKAPALDRTSGSDGSDSNSKWSAISASLNSRQHCQPLRSIGDAELSCLPPFHLFDGAQPLTQRSDSGLINRSAPGDKGGQKPDQQTKESELKGARGSTGNLVSGAFVAEVNGDMTKDPYRVQLSLKPSADGGTNIRLDVHAPIKDGEKFGFVQPINYQFKPVTDLQKKFQNDHPDIDLGHIVHLHFETKSTNGNKMTIQIKNANPPHQLSLTERVNADDPGQVKDKDGFISHDYYGVVPSTEKAGDLQLRLSLGRKQNPGEIDIKNLSLEEVSSAPGLDPATAIQQYEQNSPAGANRSTPFMFGAIGNTLIDSDVEVPQPKVKDLVNQIQKDHPNDIKAQRKEFNEGVAAYMHDNVPTEPEKVQYLKQLKEMGVNTMTVPVYWDQIEGSKGQSDYSKVDHIIELAQKEGIKVKLHPVVWADCYPAWVDKEFQQEKQANPNLNQEQYTKDVIKEHIGEVLDHFGKKFGSEIGYVEINEMNSTDVLQHPKTDTFGQILRDAQGEKQVEPVNNGLTSWISNDGPAAVINQVDAWIRESMSGIKGLKNTKVLENEYVNDQQTESNMRDVITDRNRPYALGFEAHQFKSDFPQLNANSPLLSIYQQFGERQSGGMKSYESELTVQTTPAPNLDETKLTPDVSDARGKEEEYRIEHGLSPLSDGDRKAQEKQAEELYAWFKMALANKRTLGASLWDGSERNSWNQNSGGVLDAHGVPKISYFTLQELMKT